MNVPSAHGPARVVGSASIWVLGLVAGPARTVSVLHSGDHAIYLDLEGVCLGVLGARAVQVPCGVRTQLPHVPEPASGTPVVVGDGVITMDELEVLVTNIVDTTVPVLSPEAAAWGGGHLGDLVGDRLDQARSTLPTEALRQLAAGDPSSVEALLGLGPGLTPLGDDVLAGWLAAAVASRHPGLGELRSTVALSARERTTALSATLLACAARGEGVPEFRSMLSGVADGNADVIEQSLSLLLRVGETSGEGLVLGAQLALQSMES